MPGSGVLLAAVGARGASLGYLSQAVKEPAMSDVLFVGLTVVVFVVLGLLVWGVEHFER